MSLSHNLVEKINDVYTVFPSVVTKPILTHFPELQMEPSLHGLLTGSKCDEEKIAWSYDKWLLACARSQSSLSSIDSWQTKLPIVITPFFSIYFSSTK